LVRFSITAGTNKEKVVRREKKERSGEEKAERV
jgi:hypothetical protein